MKPIKVYNLLNAKGDNLTLRLGYDPALCGTTGDNDCGLRWSFEGKRIPMPTRGWFNGFPESTMLNWLKENGWALRCIVDMPSGKATVYDLPFYDESKATETATDWIPVSTGQYPKDMETVHVTYLQHPTRKPCCDAFAYRSAGHWHWEENSDNVLVKITAWKPIGEPYKGEATPATEIDLT